MILTLLDILFLTSIVVSAFLGFFRGMVGVFLGVFIFFTSVFSSEYINKFVLDVVQEYITDFMTANLLSYFLSFLLSYCAISILFSPIYQATSAFASGILNKIFGIFAGGIRGLIINIVFFILVASPLTIKIPQDEVNEALPGWIKNSASFKYLSEYLPLEYIYGVSKNYFKTHKDLDINKLEEDIINSTIENYEKNKK